MAVLFFDGFDHYTSGANLALKWKNNGGTPGQSPRFSGYSLLVSGNLNFLNGTPQRSFANTSTIIVGSALNINQLNQEFGFTLGDTAGNGFQLTMMVDSGGNILVYRGNYATLLGTSSGFTMAINQWYYFELKATMATSATGSVSLRVGGSTILSLSGIQTASTSNPWVNCVNLLSQQQCRFDDLYVCDTTGSTNNDFLGDHKVVTVFPSANGRISQWGTQVGGTASQPWTAVNETDPDGDTSYIADNTAGDVEDFALTSAGTLTGVSAVQVNATMRKDDTASHTLGVGIGNGSSENFDSGTSALSSYSMVTRTMDSNPLTSAAWTTSDISTLQAAVKVIS